MDSSENIQRAGPPGDGRRGVDSGGDGGGGGGGEGEGGGTGLGGGDTYVSLSDDLRVVASSSELGDQEEGGKGHALFRNAVGRVMEKMKERRLLRTRSFIHPYHQLSHELTLWNLRDALRRFRAKLLSPAAKQDQSLPQPSALESEEDRALLVKIKEGDEIKGLDNIADPNPKLTWVLDFANVIKPFIGTNILVLPYAFKLMGVWPSIIGLIIVTFLTEHCCRLLLECKAKLASSSDPFHRDCSASFSGIARVALGRGGSMLVEVFVIFTQMGTCCGYVIYIGQNVNDLLLAFDTTLQPSTQVIVASFLAPVVVLIPLSFIKKMKSIAVFSLLSDAAVLVAMVLLFFQMNLAQRDEVEQFDMTTTWTPVFLGIALSAYSFISLAIPLEESMHAIRSNQSGRFHFVLDITLVMMNVLFISFGLVGYLTFAGDTQSIITANLPDGVTTNAVRVSLILAILFTYPIQLFPVSEALESMILPRKKDTRKADVSSDDLYVGDGVVEEEIPFLVETFSRWDKNAIRICLVLVTVGIAFSFRDVFGLFYALIGAFGCSFLGYVVPALLHLFIVAAKESSVENTPANTPANLLSDRSAWSVKQAAPASTHQQQPQQQEQPPLPQQQQQQQQQIGRASCRERV
eukprot:TRINITY_DN1200_c0_g1_i3.p1 TRINITY_DN1200_c0_g1~~TRINITY_DN1200_c0_g1_i3.p1  ORF type:complete len:634 (-),score=151.85 TRINITY_DN1200_c0_g1_i3:61-1962(-)